MKRETLLRTIGRIACAVALGWVPVAGTQASQTRPPADADDAIVVTGTQLTPEEARRQAVDFVRATGVAPGMQQAARWADPVCPRVLGLQGEYARIVETRMRRIAEEAGVAVARQPCDTNIAVSFVGDAGAMVRRIAQRSPRRLAEVPVTDRDTLIEGVAPIRWWYSTDLTTRDGMAARAVPNGFTGGEGAEGGGSMLPANVPITLQYNSSIISTQGVRVLTTATVIVDVDAVEGMTLDAVTDYVAMVAFAEIRARVPAPAGSVLALFEPEAPTAGLTDRDRTFLSALYRLPLDRRAHSQRGFLVRELTEGEAAAQ
jgi:hypothetical protein